MSFYLIEDLVQGTIEWHEWRKRVIGASDANSIMGEGRWASQSRLMNEKLGLVSEFGGNAATREGSALEEPARAALAREYNMQLKPTIVQDSQEPFLAASLDAISKHLGEIFEIKAGAKTYEYFRLNNKVPAHYVAQLQHILMVTQRESITFAAFRPRMPLLTMDVYRDENYIKQLRKRENDFVKELVNKGHKVQYQFLGRLVF